jgi:hypothetical protein
MSPPDSAILAPSLHVLKPFPYEYLQRTKDSTDLEIPEVTMVNSGIIL